MGKGAACGALLFAVLALAVPSATTAVASAEQALLSEINAVRAAHGLPQLHADPKLHRAATTHAREQLQRGRIDHGRLMRRLRRFGVRARLVGENVAWGVGDVQARAVVASWLASPSHRSNVLRPGFRAAGIGTAFGPFAGFDRAHLVTVDFAGT